MAHCEAQGPREVRPELAHVLRAHARELSSLTNDEARVVNALTACRTAALGGHKRRCDHCGRENPVYNSCRNRHCPKCQSLDQALWVEAQIHDLLPVHYFHEVFTVPHCLNRFFLRDPRTAFALLFEAAAKAMIDVCRSHLGATPGLIALLHTWNQQLGYHPHIHCITTGGGLSLDGTRWIASRPRFFLPVRKLSVVFRGKLLRLARARELLHDPAPPAPSPSRHESWEETFRRLVGKDPLLCPACRIGHLVIVADIPRTLSPPRMASHSRSP